jgi:hypothetical protein
MIVALLVIMRVRRSTPSGARLCFAAVLALLGPSACSAASAPSPEQGASADAGREAATSASTGQTPDAGRDGATPPGSGACIDIELNPIELTCESDTDCFLVVTGQVCPGYTPSADGTMGSLCYTAAANIEGVKRTSAAIGGVPPAQGATGPAFCDATVGSPRCVAGECTICGPIPGSAPHECPADAGADAADDSLAEGGADAQNG